MEEEECRGSFLPLSLSEKPVFLFKWDNMLMEPFQVTLVGMSGSGVVWMGSYMHHLSVYDGHDKWEPS